MLFSTGFGFWGLARTSPQFFCTGTNTNGHEFTRIRNLFDTNYANYHELEKVRTEFV